MKSLRLLFLVAILTVTNVQAQYVDRIKTDALPQSPEFKTLFEQLKEFEPMAKKYQPDWISTVEKTSLISAMKNIYATAASFAPEDSSNSELNLFLGLAAHYAYNLKMDNYGPIAEKHFIKARNSLEDDYRPDWFLALLYTNSGRLLKGIELLLQLSETFTIEDGLFWEDYAENSCFSLMPRHAIYGLDMAEKFLGRKSEHEQYFGQDIRSRLQFLNVEDTLPISQIWTAQATDSLLTPVNFPFGFKITAPKDWRSQPSPLRNRAVSINFKLPPIQGWVQPRTANLTMLIKVAEEGESLDDFTSRMLNQMENREALDLDLGLNEKAYAGIKKDWYVEEGGARLILCQFERQEPENSGMKLESPGKLPDIPQERYSVNIPPQLFNLRFKGRILYMITLDSCESIYEEALKEIKKVLKTLIVD